jgi:hypothetical protein
LWQSVAVSASGQYQTAVVNNGYLYVSVSGPNQFLTQNNTFSGNLTIATGNVLAIPNYPNVETALRTIKYEDDFLNGYATWTPYGSGSTVLGASEKNHVGTVKLFANNDRILYPASANNIFYWETVIKMEFCIKVNTTDVNIDYNIGLSDNYDMTGNTILWSYTPASLSSRYWRMKVNGSIVQSAPVVSLEDNHWFYGFIENKGSKIARFYLKNLNTGEFKDWTSNSDLNGIDLIATYRPFFRVQNTNGTGTKSITIDYVSITHNKF